MNDKINSKWDARFMKIALEISTWSKDPSRKVNFIYNQTAEILSNKKAILELTD